MKIQLFLSIYCYFLILNECLTANVLKYLAGFGQKEPKLLIILVDGFRWDYVSRLEGSLTGFPLIAENGVSAQYVKPIFPENSYPNWYSIVTGLYGESHGMIQNHMYDSKTDDLFLMGPKPNVSHTHWWTKVDPLWITAEKNMVKTAMYLWDGCQVSFNGLKPTVCEKYMGFDEQYFSYNKTNEYINKILNDFSEDKYRLSFLYYEPIDHFGHHFGPDSKELEDIIYDIDFIVYNLFQSIKERQLSDEVNVVIVSDHGMIDFKGFELIFLKDLIDLNDITRILPEPNNCQIWPNEGKEEVVYQKLMDANVKGLNIFRKNEIPEKYHYKNDDKVSPILLTTDKGYLINFPNMYSKKHLGDSDYVYPTNRSGGIHGYDVDYVQEMRAIMYGFGPQFVKNYTSGPLEMVDHYNLFCRLLGIPPNPNNGSIDRIEKMVNNFNEKSFSLNTFEPFLLYFFALNAMLLCFVIAINRKIIFNLNQ